jgi:hypothetical protein
MRLPPCLFRLPQLPRPRTIMTPETRNPIPHAAKERARAVSQATAFAQVPEVLSCGFAGGNGALPRQAGIGIYTTRNRLDFHGMRQNLRMIG